MSASGGFPTFSEFYSVVGQSSRDVMLALAPKPKHTSVDDIVDDHRRLFETMAAFRPKLIMLRDLIRVAFVESEWRVSLDHAERGKLVENMRFFDSLPALLTPAMIPEGGFAASLGSAIVEPFNDAVRELLREAQRGSAIVREVLANEAQDDADAEAALDDALNDDDDEVVSLQ